MRTIVCLIFIFFSFTGICQLENDAPTKTADVDLNTGRLFPISKTLPPMNIHFDWILETKAEIINGISYSPTIEFGLNRPNGMNIQLQTGALPVIEGLNIKSTQPCAGISFGYTF